MSASKEPASRRKKTKTSDFDFELIQNITNFMQENGLVEFDVRTTNAEIRLRRFEGISAPAISTLPVKTAAVTQGEAEAPKAAAPAKNLNLHVVKSPFVGTFYRSAGPNQDSFVEEGKIVSSGDTLCIIEAMKLMNEIESDIKGRVIKILVDNATPVEFGEALFELEVL